MRIAMHYVGKVKVEWRDRKGVLVFVRPNHPLCATGAHRERDQAIMYRGNYTADIEKVNCRRCLEVWRRAETHRLSGEGSGEGDTTCG